MATPSDKIHALAVEAHSKTEQLATELASAGADSKTLAPIKQCTSVLKEVVKASGKSGADQPAEEPEAPAEEPAPEPEQPATIASATDDMVEEAKRKRQQA